MPTLNDMGKEAFKKTLGREENAGNQHFLLFPQYLYPIKEKLHHLTLFQTTNFRLFQTERVCRRQI